MASVPPELRERYFEPVGGRHGFRADLRRSVIFGRNDLVQDAPISRIDVLACRNALMYLDAETQARILARFHFALAPAGVLFLGKAEMLLSHGARFAPVDLRRRIFRRTAQPPPGATSPVWPSPAATAGADGGTERMREALTASGAVAELVLTPDGVVAMVNRQAEALLGLSRDERGRLFRDLDVSYRPAELRRPVEVARAERRTVVLDDVTVTQASAVWELRRADPDLGARELFASAMRIGRDHVASAVNTLVLAYAGASLPLLLLFSLAGQGVGQVATSQEIATEIVRTLVGSIGLVASVPITTGLAALVASRESSAALGR